MVSFEYWQVSHHDTLFFYRDMRTARRKTRIGIGSSMDGAPVAKTEGPGSNSPPSHAVPFFY